MTGSTGAGPLMAGKAKAAAGVSNCVLLGQPNQRLSEGLRGWLQASFDSVFVVADRASLIEGAKRLRPALVVVDLALAEGRLEALLADLRREAPDSPALLLSDYEDASVDEAARAAGAAAVVHKAALAAELSAAVDAVLAKRSLNAPADERSGRLHS